MDDRITNAERAILDAESAVCAAQRALSAAVIAHGIAVKDVIRESMGSLGPWSEGDVMLAVFCAGPHWSADAYYGGRKTVSGRGDTPADACLAAIDALPEAYATEAGALARRVLCV